MPRIRCNYEGCIHLEKNICTAGEVELDQELGCLTFSQVEDEEDVVEEVLDAVEDAEEAWVEEDFDEEEDEEEDLDWDEDDEEDDWDEDEEEGGGWPSRSRRR